MPVATVAPCLSPLNAEAPSSRRCSGAGCVLLLVPSTRIDSTAAPASCDPARAHGGGKVGNPRAAAQATRVTHSDALMLALMVNKW